MLSFFILITTIAAHDIILSSGLDNWTESQLMDQYNIYSTYAKMNIISASSILVYNLDEDGNLNTYNTTYKNITAEIYQIMIKDLGLPAYPCLFCDATIGNCANLNNRLENLYSHQQEFINTTLDRAQKFNWSGYIVDFEPDQSIDADKLTHFIIDWSSQLKAINKILFVWYGQTTNYNMHLLFNTDNVRLLTINTYVSNYNNFIDVASQSLVKINDTSRLGFGLLTSEDMSEEDIIKIAKWCNLTNINLLNLWASTIPALWFEGLHDYKNSP